MLTPRSDGRPRRRARADKRGKARFDVKQPGTVVGEASRAIQARIWTSDSEFNVGGYTVTVEDAEAMRFHFGRAVGEEILKEAGFHPMLSGYWQTRFRTPCGWERYEVLYLPWVLLLAIKAYYGSSTGNELQV